jgi:hypothetical protein
LSLTRIHTSYHRRPTLSLAKAKAGRPSNRRLPLPLRRLFDTTHRRLEDRVHTRPRFTSAVRVEPVAFHARGEKGGIQISLGHNSAVADMPPLGERLALNRSTAVAGLAQSGGTRGELVHPSTGTFSLVLEVSEVFPRRSQPDGAAKATLEGPIGELFERKDVAHCQYPVGHLPVQALAMGGLFAIQFGQLGLGAKLATRLVPYLGAVLDRSVGVIVLVLLGKLCIDSPSQHKRQECEVENDRN